MAGCLRWFDVPSAQVEFHNRYESQDRIVDFRHRKQCFRMCHEATLVSTAFRVSIQSAAFCLEDLLGNSLQHASRLQNKGRQHNSTQICPGSQLRDDMGEHYMARISFSSFPRIHLLFLPLPWSGSTTVSSSAPSDLYSSTEDLLPAFSQSISYCPSIFTVFSGQDLSLFELAEG